MEVGSATSTNFMVEQDQVAKWVIGQVDGQQSDEQTLKFLECASMAWPRVLAHVRRELASHGLTSDEVTSLALEVWENTLRSVWKTWRQRPESAGRIDNLQNYLIGAFHHRLNRDLKRKRLRDSILEFRSTEQLATLSGAANVDEDYANRIDRSIQLDQVYAEMNEDTKRAVIARVYGFSWTEIGEHLHIEEQNLMMRVQYAIRKIRDKFTRTSSMG